MWLGHKLSALIVCFRIILYSKYSIRDTNLLNIGYRYMFFISEVFREIEIESDIILLQLALIHLQQMQLSYVPEYCYSIAVHITLKWHTSIYSGKH